MRKFIYVVTIFIVLNLFNPPSSSVEPIPSISATIENLEVLTSGTTRLPPALQSRLSTLSSADRMTVIITLEGQARFPIVTTSDRATRQRSLITSLRTQADLSQKMLREHLTNRQRENLVDQIIPFWIFNGLSVTAAPQVIQEIASFPEVLDIIEDVTFIAPSAQLSPASPQVNLDIIGAPRLWEAGYRGQGMVIASLDTGVDSSQTELMARWRGGTNSWFDPYGEHPDTPSDANGHGTWTMGIMVGGDGNGTSIGVAPDAQWIAAKVFNDQQAASVTAMHLAFQWILDPDGDPSTADAPHLVNNSWGFTLPGCFLSLQEDLKAIRAAGILPIFAAGNAGSNLETSVSPANYPEAFSVGAVDVQDQIYPSSSRGPSSCASDISVIFPSIVAPGVNITSTGLGGSYVSASGTSMATPHVTAGLALLLNAFPNLDVDQQAQVIISTSVDLGSPGPDNDFGNGRLDLWTAYQSLLETSTPPMYQYIFLPVAIR